MDTSICFNTFALFFIFTLYFSNEATSSPLLNSKLACMSKFGYHASIELFNISICGGAVIDDRYVVTAAHCIMNEKNEFQGYPLKVVVGTKDLNVECQHKVSVNVQQAFIPVEYDVRHSNKKNRTIGDIAILKLETDLGIKGHKYLTKLILPTKDKIYDGKEVVVSGFGYIKLVKIENSRGEGCGIRDNKLHYSKARVIDQDTCEVLSKKPASTKHLCAACLQLDPDNPTGVCDGDSGGPLVYKNSRLIGIVSSSPKHCREDRSPAVYTKVWPFLDFIKKVQNGRIDASIRNITLIPRNSNEVSSANEVYK